jgi:hypothetical protein
MVSAVKRTWPDAYEALADAVGRALLTRVQHMGLGVLAEVLPEDVLQGRAHGLE